MVISDKSTGCLVLCEQESAITGSALGGMLAPNKFIVSIRPKVLCVPSIFPNIQHQKQHLGCFLLDFCLVKSPASKILSTGDLLLATIHQEGPSESRLRLWNIEDGRCVVISPEDLLRDRRPKALFRLGDANWPGVVLCFCQQKEILAINVYTMTLI